MTSVESEQVIPELFEIQEQNLILRNEIEPYFNKDGDLFVIIAREINYRYGKNSGNLRVGIIRKTEDERGYDLVLPFSQNIIWASIDGNIVEIGYVENMELQKISLAINEEGKLDFEDYAFLLEPEDQHILKSRLVSR